jgi:hypothetical protein
MTSTQLESEMFPKGGGVLWGSAKVPRAHRINLEGLDQLEI